MFFMSLTVFAQTHYAKTNLRNVLKYFLAAIFVGRLFLRTGGRGPSMRPTLSLLVSLRAVIKDV
jgi:hypothetical protein